MKNTFNKSDVLSSLLITLLVDKLLESKEGLVPSLSYEIGELLSSLLADELADSDWYSIYNYIHIIIYDSLFKSFKVRGYEKYI